MLRTLEITTNICIPDYRPTYSYCFIPHIENILYLQAVTDVFYGESYVITFLLSYQVLSHIDRTGNQNDETLDHILHVHVEGQEVQCYEDDS